MMGMFCQEGGTLAQLLSCFQDSAGCSKHRKGGAQPQRQPQQNPGTPVAVATRVCQMPSGHARRFLCCQSIFMQTGILY